MKRNSSSFMVNLFHTPAVSVDVPKVNSFTAVNTSDRSVVLTWTPVPGVSEYLLSWRHISGRSHSAQSLMSRESWHAVPSASPKEKTL